MPKSGDSRLCSTVEIFAASCWGCAALAREIGLPIVCIRASVDADEAIIVMNDTAYGSWALWPEGFEPFKAQVGWRDWHLIPFEKSGPLPRSVRRSGGRLCIDLPPHVATAGLEAAVHGEFRRFGLTDVTTTPRWLVAQCDIGRPVLVLPRYTLSDANDFRGGAERLDSLFVMDPTFHVSLIAQAVSRAVTRVTRLADEALQHA